jgi:hypothetical protein
MEIEDVSDLDFDGVWKRIVRIHVVHDSIGTITS